MLVAELVIPCLAAFSSISINPSTGLLSSGVFKLSGFCYPPVPYFLNFRFNLE